MDEFLVKKKIIRYVKSDLDSVQILAVLFLIFLGYYYLIAELIQIFFVVLNTAVVLRIYSGSCYYLFVLKSCFNQKNPSYDDKSLSREFLKLSTPPTYCKDVPYF